MTASGRKPTRHEDKLVKVRYVTAINNLKISEDLGRGVKLDATLFITNNRSIIRNIVDRVVIPVMGTLEWSAICDSDVVIYSTDQIDSGQDPMAFLIRRIFHTQGFLHALWLVLDNAADNDLGFLIYNVGSMPMVSSNFIARGISKAEGTTEALEITRQQLRVARDLLHKCDFGDSTTDYITRLDRTSTRFGRAFYHVQSARHSKDLGMKLVGYCSAAESLFLSSQGELMHQLSERLACFLEKPGESRVETYKRFKRAYNFRSRVTHGAAIAAKDLTEVKQLSFICDGFLRRALRRLLDEGEELQRMFESADQLDEFFLTSILGSEAG
jgi:Apea-like HEPN